MKGKRYTEEFKKEAVKQVTETGYSVSDVAKRLGATKERDILKKAAKYFANDPG